MEHNCNNCVHSKENDISICSVCTNGDNEDVDNRFVPREEIEEVCKYCKHCHKTKELVNGK